LPSQNFTVISGYGEQYAYDRMPIGKPFQPGNTAAAKRGPNKITRTVKEAVLNVFNEIQDDPEIKLSAFAKKYPRDFYQIAAKLIPTELTGKIDNHIKLSIVRGKSIPERTPSGSDDGPARGEEI